MVDKYPYAFQMIGAKFIADNKRVILADDMGMFKSSQSIMARSLMEQREGRELKTLIICPDSVKEHWEDEVRLWYKKGQDTEIAMLQSGSLEQGFRRAKTADFSIINYPMISSMTSEGNGRLRRLTNQNYKYVIVDEVHNSKNPDSLRTKGVKEIIDRAECVSLLTGTPVPNGIVDIYMLMHFLEPDRYPIDFDNARSFLSYFYRMYERNPAIVKDLFHKRMMRREAKDFLDEGLPEVQFENVNVPIEGDNTRVYDEIYNNDTLGFPRKLMQLEKALMDPSLVNARLITDRGLRAALAEMPSSKYQALDSIVDKETQNGKIVIFTPRLKVGVTSKLKKRYVRYGAEFIDADVPAYKGLSRESERESVRRRFQQNDDCRVLIATSAMNEGVDLTAATAMAFLNKLYRPADFYQAISRSRRIGEVKKDCLKVYSLIGVMPDKKTVNEGIERHLKAKEDRINFIMSASTITKEEILEDMKEPHRSRPVLSVLTTPRKFIFNRYLNFRNVGGDGAKRSVERDPDRSREVVERYFDDWDYSLPGNSAKVYRAIIKGLEEVRKLENKIDLACGPGSLSYILDEPTIGVDIDPYMLEQARKLFPDSYFIRGYVHRIPIADESSDMVVFSLAYQMTKSKRKEMVDGKKEDIREREMAWRDINRVLRPGGYVIVTLPGTSLDSNDQERMYQGLEKLGFNVIQELSGYVGARNSDFGIYLCTAQKKSAPSGELDENTFALFQDTKVKAKRQKVPRREALEDFIFYKPGNEYVSGLGESIKRYLDRKNL